MLLRARRRVAFGLFCLPVLLGAWMWRAASWRPKVARVTNSPVLSLNWSGDGAQLKVAIRGALLTLNSRNLAPATTSGFAVPKNSELSVLSPDGKTVASSGGDVDDAQYSGLYSPDYWVALSDAHTGKFTARVSSCAVDTLAFSPDGKRLFARGLWPEGERWSLRQVRGQKLGRSLIQRDEQAMAACWTRDGRSVWLALEGGALVNVTRDGKPGHRFAFPVRFSR